MTISKNSPTYAFRRFMQRLSSLAAGLILAATTWGVTPLVTVQTLPPDQVDAIDTISNYILRGKLKDTDLFNLFEQLNPELAKLDQAFFRNLPVRERVSTAIQLAYEANPESAEKSLAVMSKALAQEYDGIPNEPTLKKYLSIEVADPSSLEYRLPKRARAPPINVVTKVITDYQSGGGARPAHVMLQQDFRLKLNEAVELVMRHRDLDSALEHLLSQLSAPEREEWYRRQVRELSRLYSPIQYELDLKPFLPDGHKPPTINPPRPPRPAVRVASTTSARSSRYLRLLAKTYRGSAARTFARMSRGVRGFGGIVFGNKVTTGEGIPLGLETISYSPGEDPTNGVLVFRFADQTVLSSTKVHRQDAYAAHQMIYSGVELNGQLILASQEPDEGIGLVGVDNNVPYIDPGPDLIIGGSRFRVVLHPALLNLDLGWSALMVDVLPIQPTHILRQIERDTYLLTDDQRDAARLHLRRLFESMDTRGALGTWKIVDVPMTVIRRGDGDGLAVIRSADQQNDWPVGLRRSSFIEMHVIVVTDVEEFNLARLLGTENGLDELTSFDATFSDAFYRSVPMLVRASYDYKRVNDFARVLALFRWAKTKNAKFEGDPPPQPLHVETPDAIVITTDAISPVEHASLREAVRFDLSRVLLRINEIETQPRLVEVFDKLQNLEKQSLEAFRKYYEADLGSPEEETALEELETAQAEVERLVNESDKVAYWMALKEVAGALEEELVLMRAETDD